jgi:riboflavin kinase
MKSGTAKDYQVYLALKFIKKLIGKESSRNISSGEVAELMGISQQSASRIIIRLSSEKYINRVLENRKQDISITEKGLDLLFSELDSLSQILDMSDLITIEGEVKSGLGEGRYYISRKSYIIQFQEKLGYIPYLGTLNIKVGREFENELRRLRNSSGIHIDGFQTEDRTFGPVKAFRAKIDGTECAAILPERTVYSDVLEIISSHYLRDILKLQDDSKVSVKIEIGPQSKSD